MDQFYFEEGYLETKYFVYTAEGIIDLSPYIEDAYLDADYWQYYGITSSITAELEPVAGVTVEANGSWTTAASISVSVTKVIEFNAAFDAVWTSSMTATAFKNHTAVLDTTSAMSVDAVANRNVNVLLDYIADLNSMAAKTAVGSSAIAMAASQTTQISATKPTSAALSSTTSLSINAGKLKTVQSSQSAKFTLFGSRLIGTSRPLNLDDYLIGSTPTYSSSIKKFGTHSLENGLVFGWGDPEGTNYNFIPKRDEDFYLEAFVYPTVTNSSTSIAQTGFVNISLNQGAVNIRTVTHYGGTQTGTLVYSGASDLSLNTWHHIAVINTSSGFSVYIDGTRVHNTSDILGSTLEWGELNNPTHQGTLVIGDSVDSNNCYIDEVYYLKTSIGGLDPTASTITVPTSARTNSQYVRGLWHFDNSILDDIWITHSGVAALSNTTSLSAQANANTKQVSSALTSEFTQATIIGISYTNSASLSSTTSIDADISKFVGFNSAQSAAFTQTAVIGSIKQFDAQTFVGFTSNFDADAILRPDVYLESEFAQSTQAIKTTDAQSSQSAAFTQSAEFDYIAGAASAVTVTATQTASVYRTQEFASAQSVTATMSVVIDAINKVTADLSAEFTQTASVYRTQEFTSNLTHSCSFTAQGNITHNSVISVDNEITITVDSDRIREALSDQSVEITQLISAVKITDIVSSQSANADLSSDPVKIADAHVEQQVAFTSNMDVDAILRPFVYLESQFSISTIIGVIKQFEPKQITGVQSPDVRITTPYILANTNSGFLTSIWARRINVDSSGQAPIWSTPVINSGGGSPSSILRLEYNNTNDVRLVRGNAGGPYYWNWTNVFPNDTDYHQFLIINRGWNGSNDSWELFVDGASKGIKSTYYTSDRTWWTYGVDESPGSGLRLGRTAYVTGEADIGTTSTTDLELQQIWVGINPTFNIDRYYENGIVDMGDGTRHGSLPVPILYDDLNQPFDNLYNGIAATIPQQLPDLLAYFDINAIPVGVWLFTIYLDTNSSISAELSPIYEGNASLTSSASLNIATGGGLFGGSSALNTTSTITAEPSKTTRYEAALTSTASVTARIGYSQDAYADINSTAELEVFFDVVPPTRAEAALSITTSLTADPTSYTDAIILVVSSGTLVCDATLIPPVRIQADLEVTSTLTAVVGEIEQFAVLVVSSGTMTTVAQKTTGIVQELDCEATITALNIKYTGVVANWTAFHSELVAGDVINLDPALTYVIKPETREFSILPETREYKISEETREFIILKG